MADLEIDGSHEEQFAIMKSATKMHHKTLYGNGQPGVVDFVIGTRAQFRLLIAMVTVIGVFVGILTYLEANRQYHSGELKFPKIPSMHSRTDPEEVYAKERKEKADMPYGMTRR